MVLALGLVLAATRTGFCWVDSMGILLVFLRLVALIDAFGHASVFMRCRRAPVERLVKLVAPCSPEAGDSVPSDRLEAFISHFRRAPAPDRRRILASRILHPHTLPADRAGSRNAPCEHGCRLL